ncbi:hypothetical protein GT565_11050 [Dorea longicatena]|uniref:AraC-type arabinose-binding/dimerisation domain-containing protein n=1 Tax=Dorea longicatena TaxID=88431 RepID=A0A845KPG8_9FIRM|nr:hypothetical protein [Dorea longicatena]
MEIEKLNLYRDTNWNDIKLRFCGHSEFLPLHSYGPGTRPYYLMHFVLSGKGRLVVNKTEYQITENQLFLVEPDQSVIFCGQFIHAILFCSLLLRLLSFDFSLRIFLAQAGQYLDAPEPGTYSTPHTVQFLAGIAAHRFVGMICNSSTKPMNL